VAAGVSGVDIQNSFSKLKGNTFSFFLRLAFPLQSCQPESKAGGYH
jgi:hypothetical protein